MSTAPTALPALGTSLVQFPLAWESHNTLMDYLARATTLAVKHCLMSEDLAQRVLADARGRDCNILRQAIEEIIAELRIMRGQGGHSA